MSIVTRLTLAALLSLPAWAHAQAYKCKQPNGTVSFQERPCPSDAAGSKYTLPAANGGTAATPQPRPPTEMEERNAAQRRQQSEANAYNQKVQAQNKAMRCDHARQQLGILKEPRPVYRRDKDGNRQYVEDENREAEIAAAQRRVNAECR